jgi:hypothetical protein
VLAWVQEQKAGGRPATFRTRFPVTDGRGSFLADLGSELACDGLEEELGEREAVDRAGLGLFCSRVDGCGHADGACVHEGAYDSEADLAVAIGEPLLSAGR